MGISIPILGAPRVLYTMTPLEFLAAQLTEYEGVQWPYQEPSGLVAGTNNTALALGRDVALKTYADYTAGADWSNPSGELARHVAPAVETLQQDGILAAGKTYQATVVITDRTAGSVTITDGGAAIAVNGTTLRTITSTGADFIITPTTDFDGDINLATTLVQQTNILASTAYPGAEQITNGGFDSDSDWTKGDGWTIAAGVASNDGSQISSSSLTQFSVGVVGKRYYVTYTLSNYAGVGLGFRFICGSINGTLRTSNGTFTEEVTWAGGATLQIQARVSSSGTVDNVSLTEVNPMNGVHTGVTVGQSIGPGDLLAGSFDGTNDYTNVSSAELNSMTPNTSGQVELYAQVSGAGVWTDNTLRVLLNFQVDANNYIRLSKNTSDELQWDYMAGGTLETVVLAVTPTTPFLLTLKWNVAGTGLRALYNGAQTGSNQAIAGTWVGNLAATTSVLGALNTTPDNVWSGLLALASDYRAEATDADSKRLAQLLGVY